MIKAAKVPAVAPRERAVVSVGSLTLAFTAWGLSGVKLWSLHVLLVGGFLTFFLAVMPLPACLNGKDQQHGNLQNLKRLIRFPPFWMSLIFLIYLFLQGFNPAWVLMKNEHGWWLKEARPFHWLPSSVEANYETMNSFRVLVSFGAAYLLMCGLWVGLQRRQSVVLLLWTFLLSGVGMGVVAMLQKFLGADAILWTVQSPNSSFWGTFFYRNEAVAYLTLVISISGVLYFYHLNRSEQFGSSGGPHLVLFFFVAITYTSIALALSRGGIIFGGVVTFCFLCAAICRWMYASSVKRVLPLVALTVLLLGGGGYTTLRHVDIEAIRERFGDIEASLKMADKDSRMITTKITWEMFQERPFFGWGAGSWRYVFPMYQSAYPEIYYYRYDRTRGWVGRKVYHYAHNDVVQFLCEYGLVGCLFILIIFAFWVGMQWFKTSGNRLSALMLQIGMMMAFCHALVDFIWQSPACWVALNCAICGGVKLLLLEAKRENPRH